MKTLKDMLYTFFVGLCVILLATVVIGSLVGLTCLFNYVKDNVEWAWRLFEIGFACFGVYMVGCSCRAVRANIQQDKIFKDC